MSNANAGVQHSSLASILTAMEVGDPLAILDLSKGGGVEMSAFFWMVGCHDGDVRKEPLLTNLCSTYTHCNSLYRTNSTQWMSPLKEEIA